MDQVGLEVHETANAQTSEPFPVQPQGRVVSGDGLSGERNFFKAVVLLRPEGGAISIVQLVNVSPKFFAQETLKRLLALGTPAQIAPFVADLVVNLPGHNLLFTSVMAHKGANDFLRILIHLRAVKAVDVTSAERPLLSVLKLRENTGVLFRQPGRDLSLIHI